MSHLRKHQKREHADVADIDKYINVTHGQARSTKPQRMYVSKRSYGEQVKQGEELSEVPNHPEDDMSVHKFLR